MGKTADLAKNTAIIGLGTLSTKALTFLLLPLYTNILNPNEYGLVDVLITMSTLLIPFITFEINSGVFRFLIETKKGRNYSKEEIITTGMLVELIGLSLAFILPAILSYLIVIPNHIVLSFYIISLIFSKFTLDTIRGLGNTPAYSISIFIITLVTLGLNILLIVVFNWEAIAILIASSIGNFFGVIYLISKGKLYRYIKINDINLHIGKEMLRYTFPLVPNTVSWWISSASDRLIILGYLGTTANGIYAAANRIPGIYTTLFSVFCLAWTEAVARNSSDRPFVEDTIKFSVNIMIYMLLWIIIGSSLLFDLLIGSNYTDSYWHIFILLIAIFFSSLSSLYGGVSSANMDSKSVAYSTVIGAIINITINIFTMKYIGLYAASLSTAISYMAISYMRESVVKRWYKIVLFDMKDIWLVPISLCVVMGYYLHNNAFNTALLFVITVSFAFRHEELVFALCKKAKLNFFRMKV